ncbi:MAG: type I methionyl aminopeptidase [Opitutales bacterium]|nr:type I methionyl aminopeptidase [Opitutales bacterium]
MIPIKSIEEIQKMRRAGEVSARVLAEVCEKVAPGVSTQDLDDYTKQAMDRYGAISSSYGFRSGKRVFPGYGCFSVNEEIVHGIPSKRKILKEGDIISIDLAMSVDGYCGDNTRTVLVGAVPEEVTRLVSVTQAALFAGIAAALPGNTIGHISSAIQKVADINHLGVVRELVGHGIGRAMHEDPQVPNYGIAGKGPVLKPGMTLAVEPMFTQGSPKIAVDADGWTVRTADHRMAAHWEHTILITENAPEVLTLPQK